MKVSLPLIRIILLSWTIVILLEIDHIFRKCTVLKYNYFIYHSDNEKYFLSIAKFLARCYLFNYMNIIWIQSKSDTMTLMEN